MTYVAAAYDLTAGILGGAKTPFYCLDVCNRQLILFTLLYLTQTQVLRSSLQLFLWLRGELWQVLVIKSVQCANSHKLLWLALFMVIS